MINVALAALIVFQATAVQKPPRQSVDVSNSTTEPRTATDASDDTLTPLPQKGSVLSRRETRLDTRITADKRYVFTAPREEASCADDVEKTGEMCDAPDL